MRRNTLPRKRLTSTVACTSKRRRRRKPRLHRRPVIGGFVKTILFVGGGIETVPGVRLAQAMGYRVWVSDRNPQAPCFAFADVALVADTYNGRETLAAVEQQLTQGGTLDGALCLGSDVPATVATVTEALGLPGISLQTARLAMDKLAMKDRLSQAGVALPWYQAVDDATQLAHLCREHPEALILKPVDSRGARGVLQLGTADKRLDTQWAYDYSRQFSPSGRVMVEAFLAGPQISTESLVLNGVVFTPGFSDRNYSLMAPLAPHVVEDGGNLPSFLAEPEQALIRTEVARAAAAMGVVNGVVKGDMVLSDGRAYVIEVATRLSGGYFCTHSIPLNTGVDFVGCAIRWAVGERVVPEELQPRYQRHVCQRYFFPEPGQVTAITGEAEVSARADIAFCEVRVQVGDTIGSIENHPGRPGLVIATGESRAAAQAAAERAVADLKITTTRQLAD